MRHNKVAFLFLFLFFGSYFLYAQKSILNVKSPEEMLTDASEDISLFEKPIPYGYIDQRDIMWSKVVWEVIDLDERINYPLYYPVDNVLDNSRRSLYDVLLNAIKSENLTDVYSDEYFIEKINKEVIETRIKKLDTLPAGIDQKKCRGSC